MSSIGAWPTPATAKGKQPGTSLTAVQRAAVDWLRTRGPASADQLRQALLARGVTAWHLLEQREHFWAEDCLYELYIAGHLRRRRKGGEVLYSMAAVAPCILFHEAFWKPFWEAVDSL